MEMMGGHGRGGFPGMGGRGCVEVKQEQAKEHLRDAEAQAARSIEQAWQRRGWRDKAVRGRKTTRSL